MSTRREEADKLKDAILNGRDRTQEIREEWEALGLEPRYQSPDEMRRVLMTWRKEDLVRFVIRAESAEIKAKREKLAAWAEAQEVRETALVLPMERGRFKHGAVDPFNGWIINKRGQTLDARTVFMAGWVARARAAEALSEEENHADAR